MDRLTKERRSWNMSKIQAKNTKPEIKVRSLLHGMAYRFRLHRKELPGCPDIVLSKHRAVIFIHGCFWHRHPGCKYAYTPKSRTDFWNKKFSQNVARHKKISKELKVLGWKSLVVWECEISSMDILKQTLISFLNQSLEPGKSIG